MRFRNRETGTTLTASIVCPARWTKGRMLSYARQCHPNETVRIVEWKTRSQAEDPWDTRFWIVNPKEMDQWR